MLIARRLIRALDGFFLLDVMNMRFYTLLIIFALLLTYPNVPSLGKEGAIVGTIVAYHPISCRHHQCFLWIIVSTKGSKESQPRFVQMRVEYDFDTDKPNDGFPLELVESAKEWRFRAERDVASDIAIPQYEKIGDSKAGEDIGARFAIPAWIILRGAEVEKLPYGEVLPAYQVKYNGYKPNR
jgi:hypothetical protein